jgi:hypothetical protein
VNDRSFHISTTGRKRSSAENQESLLKQKNKTIIVEASGGGMNVWNEAG